MSENKKPEYLLKYIDLMSQQFAELEEIEEVGEKWLTNILFCTYISLPMLAQ